MRSVIKQENIKVESYLASLYRQYGRTICCRDEFGNMPELEVEDTNSNDRGFISTRYVHLEWATIYETDNFNRELKKDEAIDVYGKTYNIAKVTHGVDGNLIYYVREKRYIKDEASTVAAEEKRIGRLKFVTDKIAELEALIQEEKKNKEDELMDNEIPMVPLTTAKRKWYEFWKDEQ